MSRIETTPDVDALLTDGSPVAVGVSGGKDSCAVAFAMADHLDAIGHKGPRILVHSDLGMVEWEDSLPTCERLSAATGWELLVTRRNSGGMMERWEGRWKANVRRYVELLCVKLILPWSTASLRFCTAELKRDPICSALKKRFPGQHVLSVSGIRREESPKRKKSPVAKPQPKLGAGGLDWNPILGWTIGDVLGSLRSKGFRLHNAYTCHGMSRVSCIFCILQGGADRVRAAAVERHVPLFRRMSSLEATSTFAFWTRDWLADLAPHLLDGDSRAAIERAKSAAIVRSDAESIIPKHLLYTKGWPHCVPTYPEAEMLCSVRRRVGEAVGLAVDFTDPRSVIGRYEQLMAEKNARPDKRSKPTVSIAA